MRTLLTLLLLAGGTQAFGQTHWSGHPGGATIDQPWGRLYTPDLATLEKVLAYPGSGPDSLQLRAKLLSSCYGIGYVILDLSDIRVQTQLVDVEVVDSSVVPEAVNTHECADPSDTPLHCSASFSETVTNSWSSGWTKGDSFAEGETAGFRLGSSAAFASVDVHETFTATETFGESGGHTETRTLSSGFTADFTVSPGESKKLVMRVDHATATYRATYHAVVQGSIGASCHGGSGRWNIDTLYDGRFEQLNADWLWHDGRQHANCTSNETGTGCRGLPDIQDLRNRLRTLPTSGGRVSREAWVQDVHYTASGNARTTLEDSP